MNHKYLFCLVVLSLAFCAELRKGGLPDGYYDIEFLGHSDCASEPSKFRYKPLDVCMVDVNEPEYYQSTTCTNAGYKTQTYCLKDCTQCSDTESGPIGCIAGGSPAIYSILRTCGPAPDVLYGRTWLLEYKSAEGNCSSSVLKSGRIANTCYPSKFNEAVKVECTTTTRTEITYTNCDLFTCDNCSGKSQTTHKDVGVCRDSKTLECVTI